jgi:hypothetical protein
MFNINHLLAIWIFILWHWLPLLALSLAPMLQWRFTQAVDFITHRAAELRPIHPRRPPPEPDSKPRRMSRLLIAACLLPISPCLSHHVDLQYQYSNMNANEFPLNPEHPEVPNADNDSLADMSLGGRPQAGRPSIDPDGIPPDGAFANVNKGRPRRISKKSTRGGVPRGWFNAPGGWQSFSGAQAEVHDDMGRPADEYDEDEDVDEEFDGGLDGEDDDEFGEEFESGTWKEAEFVANIMKGTISEAMKDAFAPILTKKTKVKPAAITTASGLGLKDDGLRGLDDLLKGKVKVSRYERGEGASKQKLISSLTEPLKLKFAVPDLLKLMDSNSGIDVAKMTLDTQAVIRGFADWAIGVDAWSCFQVPNGVSDFTNVSAVLSASSHTDLFQQYGTVSLEIVKSHQRFINTHCGDVEVESSHMALTVLEKSTEEGLLTRVTMAHHCMAMEDRGGVVFFKLLVDEIDKNTFESRQGLVMWITTFTIKNFDGEDVKTAFVRFKAVVLALGNDAPTDPCRILLLGMAQASNTDFRMTCQSQVGFLDSLMYREFLRSKNFSVGEELDQFGGVLVERYTSLLQAGKWDGLSHKFSAFRAMVPSGSDNKASQGKAQIQVLS